MIDPRSRDVDLDVSTDFKPKRSKYAGCMEIIVHLSSDPGFESSASAMEASRSFSGMLRLYSAVLASVSGPGPGKSSLQVIQIKESVL